MSSPKTTQTILRDNDHCIFSFLFTMLLQQPIKSKRHTRLWMMSPPPIPPPPPASAAAAAAMVSTNFASIGAAVGGQTSLMFFSQQSFVLGFLMGGFVCSAVFSTLSAYAWLGAENVKRLMQFRKTVFRHVWGVFLLGVQAAKSTLLRNNKKWQFREALKVFRESMKDTRRAAQEGVEAIRLEASLYAANVGKPGLKILQFSVDHLTPKFFAKTMEEALRDSLSNVKDKNIDRVELTSFSVGSRAPQLLDARAYELGDDAMAFDIDVRWDSELEATMSVHTTRIFKKMLKVPISIRNFNFDGVIRVVLSPLTPDPPGFGAALISLPATPNIGLDVRMAGGEVTKMPWARSEILSTLQRSIEDQFLWPRRLVIPSPKPPRKGKKIKSMLSKRELKALEHDDPLLQAERKFAKDLDTLTHHHVPPPPPLAQHQSDITTNNNDNKPPEVAVHMDITMKDTDCLEVLKDGQEELCIIDWESFEVSASKENESTLENEEATTTTTTTTSEDEATTIDPFEALQNTVFQD